MEIRQGDIYWIELEDPSGSVPGYRRPAVVIQSNAFNRSRINTVVMCALTTNLERAKSPGNILLKAGEAGLAKPSVINITQLFTADKSFLVEYSGSLSKKRIQQIVDNIHLLIRPID